MMTIKALLQQFDFPVYLAPMEGVTDRAFRRICKEYGADVLISEFISSDALSREVEKSFQKMAFADDERPFGVQIFGSTEEALTAAAKLAAAQQPDFIDINWGCPVKKIVSKGAAPRYSPLVLLHPAIRVKRSRRRTLSARQLYDRY